ncbi:MAG: hypothetical protein JWR83_908 [Aeromicrobium sp.]|nr:hypothetical protein [Aeromicrobium sp.]
MVPTPIVEAMSRRRGLFGEVSWLQVAASVLAAVTAAWIASRLGVAGTIVGAALGSFVVTITSAFYGRTLDHGRTLLIQTQSGTMIERRVEDGDVQSALDEAAEVDSPAKGAQFVDERPRLHWKTIIVTSVVVLALAIAAISTYELISGRTFDGSTGTSITDTFGGSHHKPKDTTTPTKTTPPTTPTHTATTTTPTPSPSTTTPTPTDTTPTPTDTATTG